MAYCPKCRREMMQKEEVCPYCGFDFLSENPRDVRTGLAYTTLADIALMIGSTVAAICCLGMILYSVGSLIQGRILEGLVGGPIGFFCSLAILVVFLRGPGYLA